MGFSNLASPACNLKNFKELTSGEHMPWQPTVNPDWQIILQNLSISLLLRMDLYYQVFTLNIALNAKEK